MTLLLVAAATGAGLVTGLLFAFSNFVMRALADLPNESGMAVMQRINETIINPIFLALFLGTPALCGVIAVGEIQRLPSEAEPFALIGALAYLVGPFGVTFLCNVPLNNELANQGPANADDAWPTYQQRWQRWNHIRTSVGVAATVCLTLGVGSR